jgi:hypothetical protein
MDETAPPPTLRASQSRPGCGLAVASLVLGIAGIVLCLGPLAGIPGVICGHIAWSRIKKAGGALQSEGLAVAGLVTSYVAIAMIVVIALGAAIAIPNFVKAREMQRERVARQQAVQSGAKTDMKILPRARYAAQKAGCAMNLRAIEGAKAMWALEHRKQTTDLPVDSDLFGANRYMREKPSCPANGNYSLNDVAAKPTCSIPDHTY